MTINGQRWGLPHDMDYIPSTDHGCHQPLLYCAFSWIKGLFMLLAASSLMNRTPTQRDAADRPTARSSNFAEWSAPGLYKVAAFSERDGTYNHFKLRPDMKVIVFLSLLVPFVVAQDGYAALNGGTTGGAGGTTTTVSAAAAFQTAIKVLPLVVVGSYTSDL